MSTVELSIDIPAEHEKNIFGAYDEHIKSIEKTLNVEVNNRNGAVRITGSPMNTAKAKRLLAQLLIMSERGTDITTQNVTYALSLLMDGNEGAMEDLDSDTIIHTMAGRPIKPKTLGQKEYVDSIRKRMITFGIGPAGTGKTYLGMAMAIRAFRRDEVSRIILT
ncbi:MAG: PhoH family protein, partial [Lachnospiraceae bacterium]|nr:PhoH family protein [Lachnospiraceae bacterium]